ncbi:hypothetical protein E2C01_044552 [Portunus trituberculatus]|uniref:Uncharacterized protein n=1 Tax=Portunus trituberculatus TaxID=210409 RepID=A0A5B7FVY5_PORTR|nr:hypothetical protein [Portunus trituberculatus]
MHAATSKRTGQGGAGVSRRATPIMKYYLMRASVQHVEPCLGSASELVLRPSNSDMAATGRR